jgi:hypothetical protein
LSIGDLSFAVLGSYLKELTGIIVNLQNYTTTTVLTNTFSSFTNLNYFTGLDSTNFSFRTVAPFGNTLFSRNEGGVSL